MSSRLGRATFAAAALAIFVAFPIAAAERPNFIIFIADDVGWNDIGCYGHPHIKTPHLDRMAKEGMKFDRAFLTCSSCSPSRCSILTGRYPHSTGAGELHMPLPADQIVFAGLLKEAGYYTASSGKWHLGNDARKNFDRIEGGAPSGCEKWLQVLEERPRDKPFFFWFASLDAHRGYRKGSIAEPHSRDDVVVPPFLPDAPQTRDDLALYYDEISRLDEYIGKVHEELGQQGAAENTLVMFISDNGRPFPRCKTTVYDSGVRTPLLVRWPKRIKPASLCQNLVSSVDIAPTVLELAGVSPPKTLQGVSFAPLLMDPRKEVRPYAVSEHNWHDYSAHERGVRTKDFLYIRNAFPELAGTPPADAVRSPTFAVMKRLRAAGTIPARMKGCFLTPRPREELYNVRLDPHCLKNLADDERFEAERTKMRARLAEWSKATGDRIPKNPTPDWFHRVEGTRLKGVQGKRGDPLGG